jgi:hypothetical protein
VGHVAPLSVWQVPATAGLKANGAAATSAQASKPILPMPIVLLRVTAHISRYLRRPGKQ